jgi:mannose-6-phosphate isomerase-like protein (cupin superfamily)
MNDEGGVMPLSVISRHNAEHYIWGTGCDGWHAAASEVVHYHRKSRQFFLILAGQAVMEADGRRISLFAGQGLQIPPGTYHRFYNESDESVRFLVVSQPPSHGDRVTE